MKQGGEANWPWPFSSSSPILLLLILSPFGQTHFADFEKVRSRRWHVAADKRLETCEPGSLPSVYTTPTATTQSPMTRTNTLVPG